MRLFYFKKTAGVDRFEQTVSGKYVEKTINYEGKSVVNISDESINRLKIKQIKALRNAIKQFDITLSKYVDIKLDGSAVFLFGPVTDQETLARMILIIGNTKGIEYVDEDIVVENKKSEQYSQFYAVVEGDSLNKIANTILEVI